ncbi:hypothetical protein SBBP1_1580003 [Burkholderiales bacterium]|nr:hypothetical protein SBBP1_1580003 [Burkholderiales bacterium]
MGSRKTESDRLLGAKKTLTEAEFCIIF